MLKVIEILKSVWAFLTVIFMGITGLISPTPPSTDDVKLIDEMQFVLDGAYAAGQGLAIDGDTLYTSGAISATYTCALAKIDMTTGKMTQKNLIALSPEFTTKGYDHIGAIGYYDGIIYAPVEDKAEEYPLVLLYDAETLEYTGTYYDIEASYTDESGNEVQYLDDGIPWCTVDAEKGLLYTSTFHNAEEILAFDLDDMSFAYAITLDDPIDRIQSAVCCDGRLYANCDPKGENKTVYEVDLATGESRLLFDRPVTGFDCETEGMAVRYGDDGKLQFIIADYDKLVSIFIRTYELA